MTGDHGNGSQTPSPTGDDYGDGSTTSPTTDRHHGNESPREAPECKGSPAKWIAVGAGAVLAADVVVVVVVVMVIACRRGRLPACRCELCGVRVIGV